MTRISMSTTVSVDDESYRRALDVADPDMAVRDLFREAVKVRVRVRFVRQVLRETPAMSPVLAATSIRVEHFRRASPVRQSPFGAGPVPCHPLNIPELASGSPPAARHRAPAGLGHPRQTAVTPPGEALIVSVPAVVMPILF